MFLFFAIFHIYATVPLDKGPAVIDMQQHKKEVREFKVSIKKNPKDKSLVYELAKCYNLAKDYYRALETFEKRVSMKGNKEEVYSSLLEIAKIKDFLNVKSTEVIASYNAALKYRPARIESMYYLGHHYLKIKENQKALEIASKGLCVKCTKDKLHVDDWIYDYGQLLLHADAAFLSNQYNISLDAYYKLLLNEKLPSNIEQQLKSNLLIIKKNLFVKEKVENPDAYFLTMKKAGTHMAEKCLRMLMAKDEYEYQYILKTSDDHRALAHIQGRDGFTLNFRHIDFEANSPFYNHVFDKKKIVVIRDPRDMLISGANFIPMIFMLGTSPNPPSWAASYVQIAGEFLKKWDELPITDKINSLVTQSVPKSIYQYTPEYYKLDNSLFIPPFDFTMQIFPTMNFIHSPNTLIVRYEDLVGPQGGGTQKAQVKCIKEIAEFIGIEMDDERCKNVGKDLYGSTFTFRKGKLNAWKTTFDEENKKLFKEHLGKALIQMGYEKDNNW